MLRKNLRTVGLFMAMLTSGQPGTSGPQAPSEVPPDSVIRKILSDRIDKYHQSVGIVVGIIEPRGQRTVAYGQLNQGDRRPLNGDTVFEIDSLTKVFTGLLLTDMVARGEVALADPVAKYLPSDVRVPVRGGRQITLLDLVTHHSGLPHLPLNAPLYEQDPLGNYTTDQLYSMVAAYHPDSDPGAQYFYSNVGFGLLGQALARRAGMDFQQLLESRITGPLRMVDTRISPTPEMNERFAIGHGYYRLAPTSGWSYGALAGAGGVRSTANDLLRFLAACMGYTKTPLAGAMAAMLETRQPTGELGTEIALAWLIQSPNRCGRSGCEPMGLEFVVHGGGSFGYTSFFGFDPKSRVGVVVLSNASHYEVADIGLHVLNSRYPIPGPKQLELSRRRKDVERQTAISIDPKLLDAYAGVYKGASETWAVRQEGTRLFMQDEANLNKGYTKMEILPKDRRDFFFLGQDSEVMFDQIRQGRSPGLILYDEDASVKQFQRID